MSEYGDKESIYDEKISLLMTKIIEICQTEGINMVASFQLRSDKEDEQGDMLCTTNLPMNNEHWPSEFGIFCRLIFTE